MSHFLKTLIPEEGISVEAQRSASKVSRKINSEALHRYALFERPILCRGKDGRTYDYIDENGQHVSHFVSQYSPLINDSIEPEIKVLVRLLHSMGYLTVGSCQGHDDSKFRWVMMAFTREQELKEFVKLIDSFRLPISWYENFLNFKEKPRKVEDDSSQLNFTWDQKIDSNRSIEQFKAQGYTEAELTRYLNIMFNRQEKKYFLIKMVICSKMGNKGLWEEFKWKRLYKKRNAVTEQLIHHLSERQRSIT